MILILYILADEIKAFLSAPHKSLFSRQKISQERLDCMFFGSKEKKCLASFHFFKS
jgi:hypothetical protein